MRLSDTSTHTHAPHCPMNVWHKRFFTARAHLNAGRWEDAIEHYQYALSTAEKILHRSNDTLTSSKRYGRTALEFAYAVRMGDYPCNLNALVAIVDFHLKSQLARDQAEAILVPLRDIVFNPIAEIDYWMKVLFSMEDKKSRRVH